MKYSNVVKMKININQDVVRGTVVYEIICSKFEVKEEEEVEVQSSKFEVNKRLSREPGNLASKTKT